MTAFIWDLDGTLIDSYPAIMEALEVVYQQYDLAFDAKVVGRYILQKSVGDLLLELSQEHRLDYQDLKRLFATEQKHRDYQIRLLPNAKELLDWTVEKGIANFMYTHKGNTTHQVLQRLGIASYFQAILTSDSGFARKPNPQALDYLIANYHLNPDQTYYIGDRLLDVQAAENAGIKSLNLSQKTASVNQKIASLSEIKHISFL